MKRLIFKISLFFPGLVFSQNINVDTQLYTAQELVEDLLIDSGCITNVAVTGTVSGNFSGAGKSFGYFDGNGSVFPFQSGIVMSTGKLSNVPGPNNSLSDDDAPNWTGDADLEQTLGINDTHNATIIEFDFTPNADKIRFRYIFASEEYQENDPNTCVYSDVFAFLIKPVGGQYTNIALVAGTSTPVKVTTVHPEIPGNGGCPAQNEAYFESFNGVNSPINFNGQTIPLTAESNVVPGQVYHIKLVIADDQNYRYDSAVFLEAGSFNIGAELGPDLIGKNALCAGETHLLQVAQNGQTPLSHAWFKNGVLIPGETTGQLSVSNAGTYKIEVDFGNACIAVDEVLVQYADLNGLSGQKLFECGDENGTGIYDFTDVEEDLLNKSSQQIDGYFLSQTDAANNANPIQNPKKFQNSFSGQIVFARVSWLGGDCFKVVEIRLFSAEEPSIDPSSKTQSICKGETPIILESGVLGDENEYSFLWNTNETSPMIEVGEPGEYSVKITKKTEINGITYSCFVINEITVSVSEKAEIDVHVLGEFGDNSVEINTVGNGDYVFALDDGGFQKENLFPVSAGKHTAFVKDLNGCGIVSEDFYILDYPKFFTPNNDGTNDYWRIIGAKPADPKNPQIASVSVYDRYGKLLTAFSPQGNWDGTYNGKPLPSDDYWFRVEFLDGSVFAGHFSLIR